MKLHHVGITFYPVNANFGQVLEYIQKFAKLFEIGNPIGQIGYEIEEWDCVCYPAGMVEFIELHDSSPMLKYHKAFQQWSKLNSPFVLHHIALEVKQFDKIADAVQKIAPERIIGASQYGYMGKRIMFIHPSVFGFLIEIVEA